MSTPLQDPRFYNIDDFKQVSDKRFHKFAFDYFNPAANDEVSLRSQEKAYRAIKLK